MATAKFETPALKPGSGGGVSDPRSLTIIRVIVLSIVLVWLVPAIGLLLTSLRGRESIETSGWWSIFANPIDYGWTLANYSEVLTSGGFDTAFVNTLVVSVPATVIPITIAAFAAYAFSWMDFKGRYGLFVLVVALLVVPLHVALIPILRLYANGVAVPIRGTHIVYHTRERRHETPVTSAKPVCGLGGDVTYRSPAHRLAAGAIPVQ